MTWVREGECCRCGQCCVGDPGFPNMPRPAKVDGMCPFYDIETGGKGWCSAHDPINGHEYYKGACFFWPQNPAQIADKPLCSYTFWWRGE